MRFTKIATLMILCGFGFQGASAQAEEITCKCSGQNAIGPFVSYVSGPDLESLEAACEKMFTITVFSGSHKVGYGKLTECTPK